MIENNDTHNCGTEKARAYLDKEAVRICDHLKETVCPQCIERALRNYLLNLIVEMSTTMSMYSIVGILEDIKAKYIKMNDEYEEKNRGKK